MHRPVCMTKNFIIHIQIFSGDNFEPRHSEPDNSRRNIDHDSEVDRRVTYFEKLEETMSGGREHPLLKLTRDCLHNTPSERPTAERLVAVLEKVRTDIDGPYRKLAIVDALRQVMIMKVMKEDMADIFKGKEEKIRQLEVSFQLTRE